MSPGGTRGGGWAEQAEVEFVSEKQGDAGVGRGGRRWRAEREGRGMVVTRGCCRENVGGVQGFPEPAAMQNRSLKKPEDPGVRVISDIVRHELPNGCLKITRKTGS